MINTVTKSCSQCGTTFDCSGCLPVEDPSATSPNVLGVKSNSITCWCMAYPPLLRCDEIAPADNQQNKITDCLCPECLGEILAQKIALQIDNIAIHKVAPDIPQSIKDLPLIEGLDYQIDALGRWVLSRWYLLKRGECCGNACRNCPFGYQNVIKD